MANFVTRLVTSALNYWLGFMVDVTVAGFFLAHTLTSMHRPLLISCLVVLAGLGLYGLLEYVFHRWIYHGLMVAVLVSNFVYYGLLHHSQHHSRLKVRYFLSTRSHHLIHHHFPDRNFGLTTTLWDWVFRTHYLSARDLRTGEASR